MTLGEVLTLFKIEKPTRLDDALLIKCISDLELTVCREVFLTHEGAPARALSFEGYTASTPLETELLIPAPYDGIYSKWLSMQVDRIYCDVQRYNNSASLFYNEYMNFASYYNREHLPLSRADSFTTE